MASIGRRVEGSYKGSDSKVSCWARCEGSDGREKKIDRKGGYSEHD
jgi:hypothetical protein